MTRMVGIAPLAVVLASIVLPVVLARRGTRQAYRTLVLSMALIILVWGYLCLSVYPRYVFPQ